MGSSSTKSQRLAAGNNNGTVQSFKVVTLDENGRSLHPGTIEVTSHDLILIQKGNVTTKWPLNGLRRYGFDKALFSFECGRKCSTGQGIFAFKCSRAEALFNLLQENILRASRPSERRHSVGVSNVDSMFAVGQWQQQNGGGVNVRSLNPNLRHYENNYLMSILNSSNAVVINDDDSPFSDWNSPIQYADLDLETSRSQHTASSNCKSAYVNIPSGDGGGERLYRNRSMIDLSELGLSFPPASNTVHQYQNLNVVFPENVGPRSAATGASGTKPGVARASSAVVSSKKSAGPGVNGTANRPIGYAVIDFDRTQALNLDRPTSDDEGVRKTRHSVTTE